jgi:hypothetical protein
MLRGPSPRDEKLLVRPEQAEPRRKPTAQEQANPALRLEIHRMNDNELIFFDKAEQASWIIYPPRSLYAHIHRPRADATIVEHHPWAPMSEPQYHAVGVLEGCAEHGLDCFASAAVRAAAEAGWNAFT